MMSNENKNTANVNPNTSGSMMGGKNVTSSSTSHPSSTSHTGEKDESIMDKMKESAQKGMEKMKETGEWIADKAKQAVGADKDSSHDSSNVSHSNIGAGQHSSAGTSSLGTSDTAGMNKNLGTGLSGSSNLGSGIHSNNMSSGIHSSNIGSNNLGSSNLGSSNLGSGNWGSHNTGTNFGSSNNDTSNISSGSGMGMGIAPHHTQNKDSNNPLDGKKGMGSTDKDGLSDNMHSNVGTTSMGTNTMGHSLGASMDTRFLGGNVSNMGTGAQSMGSSNPDSHKTMGTDNKGNNNMGATSTFKTNHGPDNGFNATTGAHLPK